MVTFEPVGPLNIRDTASAPNLPGLYVWYARLRLGKPDWREDLRGEKDQGAVNLWGALASHSAKFSKQSLAVEATANFNTVWSGVLQEELANRLGLLFRQTLSAQDISLVERMLDTETTRGAFVDILRECFPTFFAPLYVGKTSDQTLAVRLHDHASEFLACWDSLSRNPGLADDLRPKSFAHRAIKLGFGPDDLHFYAVGMKPKNDAELTPAQLASALEAAEWILNRWSTPVLGRS